MTTASTPSPVNNEANPIVQGPGHTIGRLLNRMLKVVAGAIFSGLLVAFLSVPLLQNVFHLNTKDTLYGFLMVLAVVLGSALGATLISRRSWAVIILVGFGAIVTAGFMAIYSQN